MKKICKFSLNDPLEGWIGPIVWIFLYLTKTLHDLTVTINIREYQNQWAVTLHLLEELSNSNQWERSLSELYNNATVHTYPTVVMEM